jgi:hypothetical protein
MTTSSKRPTEHTTEYTNRLRLERLARNIKDHVDGLPVKRIGILSRWNYVRRVDVYEAIDNALEAFSHDR